MKLSNSYLGFTDNVKGVQKARIESLLDTQYRYDGVIKTQKQFIYDIVEAGYRPEVEEDYTYYKRNGELSKPKTLYTMENRELNSLYETNKTLNNFATYIIENNFLDVEKATEWINEEQRQVEEAAKLEREEKERIRLENERKRQEEEKQRQERVKNNIEQGMKFIEERDLKNTITEITRNHWSKLKECTNQDLETFIEYAMKHFATKFSNMGLVQNNLQYLIHEISDHNKTFADTMYETDVLKTIFNVNDTDSKHTITAKVKAYYENREYKGGNNKPAEIKTFYYYNAKEQCFVECAGEVLNFKGIDHKFFIHELDGKYTVSEVTSGARITNGTNKAEVIKKARESVNKNKDRLTSAIEYTINKTGLSPIAKQTA